MNSDGAATNSLYRACFLSVILVVAVLLVYLWGHVQTMKQGQVLAQLRTERKTLVHEQDRLRAQISGLNQSNRIRYIASNKLDMVFPTDPPRNLYLDPLTK